MPLASGDHATSSMGRVRAQIVISALAALFGVGSGALMAYIAPTDKFGWAGLAIAPLWLLLETCFEGVAAVASSPRVRITATIVVLAGFYGAWISLRT